MNSLVDWLCRPVTGLHTSGPTDGAGRPVECDEGAGLGVLVFFFSQVVFFFLPPAYDKRYTFAAIAIQSVLALPRLAGECARVLIIKVGSREGGVLRQPNKAN